MSLKLILLLENDVNLRQSIALLLIRAGYLVTATDCLEKALDLVHSAAYHLLIFDFNILDNHSTFLPDVLNSLPNLPIVILTDQCAAEVEAEKKQSSALFLHKPVAPERLLESIGSTIANNNHHHLSSHARQVDRH